MTQILSTQARSRLLAWRGRVIEHAHGDALMLSLAAVIGVGTGLLAALLIQIIALVQRLTWGSSPGWLTVVLVPTLGALVVGLIIRYAVPETSGSGIIQTMKTIALQGGRFRGIVPLGGLAASGIGIGTGAAGGREGPIVLIGGSFGSLLGRFFALDEDQLRTLVAAGAAAGIGASFNAPIGGMLFAIELIIGGFRARSFQWIVVASVAGSITARQVIGPEIIYRPADTYTVGDPRELLLYAALGLAAVGIGAGFLYGEDLAKRLFARLGLWTPAKLALGGLALGIVALGVPEVLGTGSQLPPVGGVIRNPIQAMLNGEVGAGYAAAAFLLLLAGAKLVATCLSIGSGNAVGTFAPVIFTGAALGGAMGHVADQLLTSVTVQPGAFALVGMAAAFGAAARAPLTAIVIVFEITGDYELVLPLMLATGLATFLAERVMPDSVYTYPLRKKGIIYAEPEDVDIMQTVRIGEVMTREPDTVPPTMSLEELDERFRTSGHHGYPVVEGNNHLVGVVTLTDLARARDRQAVGASGGRLEVTVGDVCTHRPATVTPDDPVYRGLRRMAALDVGRLPVVAADDHTRLVGVLRRSDLVSAYQHAVARTVSTQHRRETSRVRELSGVKFVEVSIAAGSAADGATVRSLDWPARTVVTSVRRQDRVVVPRGDTVLLSGDTLVVLTAPDGIEPLRALVT